MCAVGILGRFLILGLIVYASAAPHESTREAGLSSNSIQTRRYETEVNRQCERPSPPSNGHFSCIINSNEYSCTAGCMPGYTFPDGSDSKKIECSRQTGQWLPRATFEDCTRGSGEGNVRSFFETNEKKCQEPSPPNFGRIFCTLTNNKYSCIGSCFRGYAFADGSDSKELECSEETGQWFPDATFEDCTEVHEKCQIPSPPSLGGFLCHRNNEKYLCTGTCNRGYAFPGGSNHMDLECSRETGQWTPYASFEDCIRENQ